jgi:hypothetical protein
MPDQGKGGGKGKREGKEGGREKSSDTKQGKHDMSKVKCFACNKFGHIAPNCPEKAKEKEDTAQKTDQKAKTYASWDDDEEEEQLGTFVTYQVCHGVEPGRSLQIMICCWTIRQI